MEFADVNIVASLKGRDKRNRRESFDVPSKGHDKHRVRGMRESADASHKSRDKHRLADLAAKTSFLRTSSNTQCF